MNDARSLFSPLGKAVSESAGDSPPEQLKVNSAPSARSEVIYDDVPCENNSPPDAGQCLLSVVDCPGQQIHHQKEYSHTSAL